ncbi:MAG: hypothetical protein IPN36_15820 [Bacteroidetes bacterium]|nr:hypothetical protein [Bacteroidota bacterium]
MSKHLYLFLTLIVLSFQIQSQIPHPALVGYWQNWNDVNAPYIPIDQVDNRYNVIEVSFAIPQFGTDYRMEFIPDQVTPANFISQNANPAITRKEGADQHWWCNGSCVIK